HLGLFPGVSEPSPPPSPGAFAGRTAPLAPPVGAAIPAGSRAAPDPRCGLRRRSTAHPPQLPQLLLQLADLRLQSQNAVHELLDVPLQRRQAGQEVGDHWSCSPPAALNTPDSVPKCMPSGVGRSKTEPENA